MSEATTGGVMWRRVGQRNRYLGTCTEDDGVVRLCGRDALTGVEVRLSIPLTEIAWAHAGPHDGSFVLELASSDAIVLRVDAAGSAQTLVRRLAALAWTESARYLRGGDDCRTGAHRA